MNSDTSINYDKKRVDAAAEEKFNELIRIGVWNDNYRRIYS